MLPKNAHISLNSNWIRFERIDNTTGYLIGEHESVYFNSFFHVSLFETITDTTIISELIDNIKTYSTEAVILFEIMMLLRKGYIKLSKNLVTHIGDGEKNYRVITGGIVFSGTDSSAIDALKSVSIALTLDGTKKVNIVTCCDYLEEKFILTITALHKEKNNVIIPVKLNGELLWIGPIFRESSPCPFCVEYQVRQNKPIVNYIEKLKNSRIQYENKLSSKELEKRAEIVFNIINNQFLISNTIITINPENSDQKLNHIRSVPQCSNCGNSEMFKCQVKSPILFRSLRKKSTKYGGFRSVTPDRTWDKLKDLISPVTGIVSHIGPHKEKNHPVRSVWSAAFFVNPHPVYVKPGEVFVRNSYGKGVSESQSRVSALCEAVERYAAQYTGDEPVIKGTVSELVGKNPVSPFEIIHYSKEQYNSRHRFQAESGMQAIPPEYNLNTAVNWTYAWSITFHRSCLLPLTYCYMFAPYVEKECYFPFCTNGNASGNTLEEAVLQGILELIERDAIAIWWYNRIKRPSIDLKCFNDPYFDMVKEQYQKDGYDIWVLDLTHDLDIPVMAAIARHNQTKNFIIGFGAHLDLYVAVQRAVTEMHQVYSPNNPDQKLWGESDIDDPSFLFPTQIYCPDLTKYTIFQHTPINDDVMHCVNILKRKNLETIVLNYTRPDIAFPTVKVIVPGLRHFWKRLGEGRLYSVPVEMGWLKKACREDEMNPLALEV